MQIVSALFVQNIDFKQGPAGNTLIDLSGVYFSTPAPAEPPVTIEPHLVALIWCGADEDGRGVFEVVFELDEHEIARNVSPFSVEPGKFTYRLVRGELTFPTYGQVIARCRVDRGPWHAVPLTLLPPV
jgi:hypothetical protein